MDPYLEDPGGWPIGLREPLPRIGVPLRPDVDDVEVALQPLLDLVYEEGRYADLLDYTRQPPAPPLAHEDAAWAALQIERWLQRRAGDDAGRSDGQGETP
jgi:hypothetical protein